MHDPAAVLLEALSRSVSPPTLAPLLLAIRDVLANAGVSVERIQIPLNRMSGFRHPTLGLLIATWSDTDGVIVDSVDHNSLDKLTQHGVIGTPFEPIVLGNRPHVSHDLTQDSHRYPIFETLRARGYTSYCAVGLPVPTGTTQPMSVVSRSPFDAEHIETILRFRPLFSLAIYAAYRTSQAYRVAESYIGLSAGPEVHSGNIKRGSTQTIQAGIMFCDIRGFTPLSSKLGAERVVEVVNEVFEVVGREAEARGGEILKFIGDAILLVFPIQDNPVAIARAMVETARASMSGIHELEHPVGLGFGGHIGEVVQGNIGTPRRLDFTVMGPAVNLASRLESLSRPLGVGGVFSEAVAHTADDLGLRSGGAHLVKGVETTVAVWVLE